MEQQKCPGTVPPESERSRAEEDARGLLLQRGGEHRLFQALKGKAFLMWNTNGDVLSITCAAVSGR